LKQTNKGQRVRRQVERFLNTPTLVRETSRYNPLQRVRNALGLGGARTPVAMDAALAKADKTFSDVILAADVKDSVRALAASAANTRLHAAPFRHYLLYGAAAPRAWLYIAARQWAAARALCSSTCQGCRCSAERSMRVQTQTWLLCL
jgi:hypothetical protein